ncbi:MAG: ATP-binding protein [Candidatus Roizmanbacteria bacterium]|nr:ATP-binding protein [Candidatus Roizmanbacteria bacterium]
MKLKSNGTFKKNLALAKHLENMLDHLPFGISVENRRGRILYANKEMAEIFNYTSLQDVVNQNIKTIFNNYKVIDKNGVEHSFEERPAAKIFKGLDELSEQLRFIDKKTGREKQLSIHASAIKGINQKTNLAIKSYRDISRIIEEQRQKELFFGVLNHEFKSPLASIKAFAQLLKRRITAGSYDRCLDYIMNIEMQADRLTRLIGEFLDVTRLLSGELQLNRQKFNLDQTIDKVIENFKFTAEKYTILRKGKLTVEYYGDEDRLVQVLLNLLSNSVEHSTPKTTIEVRTTRTAQYISISVKDYGSGIAQRYQRDIFQLFRRVRQQNIQKNNGVGMGLSISQSIVKAHGGEILLKSKVGKGSEFIIKLPIASS